MSARLALSTFAACGGAPGGLLLIILLFGAILELLNAAVLLTEIAVLGTALRTRTIVEHFQVVTCLSSEKESH